MSFGTGDIVYEGLKVLAWTSFHSYLRLRTFGMEGAPRRGPLLVASNHVSALDPIIIGVALRQRVYFLARETLLRGFWGWLMQVLGARPIRRDSADRTAIGLALELLGRGDTVVMFPEGTRSGTGEVQEVRHGIGMIAARANCPVLPVYIAGARELLPRGKNLPKPGSLAFFAGTVLSPDSIPPSENARDHYAEIAGRVHAALSELEDRARRNGWIGHPS